MSNETVANMVFGYYFLDSVAGSYGDNVSCAWPFSAKKPMVNIGVNMLRYSAGFFLNAVTKLSSFGFFSRIL